MLDTIIIIILIIVLIVLLLNKVNCSELFESSTISNNKIGLKIENINSGTRSFDDKLFDDVIMYESDPADINKSGVYKCLENCKGSCLEFGITGNTFCFPKK